MFNLILKNKSSEDHARIEYHPALDKHHDGVCAMMQIEFFLVFISIKNKFIV